MSISVNLEIWLTSRYCVHFDKIDLLGSLLLVYLDILQKFVLNRRYFVLSSKNMKVVFYRMCTENIMHLHIYTKQPWFLQVNFENDPEAALVTFSTNKEALSCYRSTEPLFNNRFVKVFWHKNKDKSRVSGWWMHTPNISLNCETFNKGDWYVYVIFLQETSEGAGDQQQDQRSVKERLGPPIIPHPSKLSLNNTKPKTVEQPPPSVKEKVWSLIIKSLCVVFFFTEERVLSGSINWAYNPQKKLKNIFYFR